MVNNNDDDNNNLHQSVRELSICHKFRKLHETGPVDDK